MVGNANTKKETNSTVRASISFSREQYEMLQRIAKEKKVSVAWVVRDAVEKYFEMRWPLFPK